MPSAILLVDWKQETVTSCPAQCLSANTTQPSVTSADTVRRHASTHLWIMLCRKRRWLTCRLDGRFFRGFWRVLIMWPAAEVTKVKRSQSHGTPRSRPGSTVTEMDCCMAGGEIRGNKEKKRNFWNSWDKSAVIYIENICICITFQHKD